MTAYKPMARRWLELPVRDFSEARCKGLSWMFDSTERATHIEAAKLCADCPLIATCREHLEAVSAASSGRRHGGGPVGTWAGLLVSKGGKWKAVA